MTMHYNFVDIAIKQDLRNRLREAKGMKSYSKFIEVLLEKSLGFESHLVTKMG